MRLFSKISGLKPNRETYFNLIKKSDNQQNIQELLSRMEKDGIPLSEKMREYIKGP